jgi:hypothetical protein
VSSNEQAEFTGFFQESWEPCLRAVVAVTGRPQLAEDQVAEAFAKAWRLHHCDGPHGPQPKEPPQMLPAGRIMRAVYRALVLREERLSLSLRQRLQDPLRVVRRILPAAPRGPEPFKSERIRPSMN